MLDTFQSLHMLEQYTSGVMVEEEDHISKKLTGSKGCIGNSGLVLEQELVDLQIHTQVKVLISQLGEKVWRENPN